MIPETIDGQWIGDLRGSRVANLFAEFVREDQSVRVNVRVSPLTGGPADVYVGALQVKNGTVGATVTHEGQSEPAGAFWFNDIRDAEMGGSWETADRNRGVFILKRARLLPVQTSQDIAEPREPPQIVTRSQKLPKFTIFRDELQDLIKVMKELVPTPLDAGVRASLDGIEIILPATDFWAIPSLPRETDYLVVSLQEQASFAPKTISVNLSVSDCSFTVSGSSEVWVNGAFTKIDRYLGRRRGFWRTAFEKHALNINGIAFLLALTLAPSLDLASRIVLMLATLLGAVLFKLGHDRATKVRIFLRDDYKSASYIDFPRLWTTLLGALVIAIVTGIFAWLSNGGLQGLLDFLALASKPGP